MGRGTMRATFRSALSVALLALLAGAGGCSDDSEEREMIVIDIEGGWELEATLDQDQGDLTCQISGLEMAIEMQGNTQLFGGQTSPGTVSCTGPDTSLEVALPGLTITNGQQDMGSVVSFKLAEGEFDGETTFLDLEGDLTGIRMEGQISGFIRLEEPGADTPATAFTGTFVNTRTSS